MTNFEREACNKRTTQYEKNIKKKKTKKNNKNKKKYKIKRCFFIRKTNIQLKTIVRNLTKNHKKSSF